jgi:hypothetical protein
MHAIISFLFDKYLPITTGAIGWGIATLWQMWLRRRERREDAESHRKAAQKRDDFEHYKILISMYQNFLVMTLPYVDLNIHPEQEDLDLDKGSPEFARRRILYEYLFYMFERAFMLKAAMEDVERLGDSVENRWKGWEIWIESYLRKESVQEEFASVGDYGLNEDFQDWIRRKIKKLKASGVAGRSKKWAPLPPDR